MVSVSSSGYWKVLKFVLCQCEFYSSLTISFFTRCPSLCRQWHNREQCANNGLRVTFAVVLATAVLVPAPTRLASLAVPNDSHIFQLPPHHTETLSKNVNCWVLSTLALGQYCSSIWSFSVWSQIYANRLSLKSLFFCFCNPLKKTLYTTRKLLCIWKWAAAANAKALFFFSEKKIKLAIS